MSASEESLKPENTSNSSNTSLADRLLDFVSSIRFGAVLTALVVAYATIGAYGFGLSYGSWYFRLVLLVLCLNIVFASVNLISAVRFGVIVLCTLVVFSMIGMLIIQQNVQGFDAYFASLTPAEKLVYGTLGLFDIYHSWYYNLLLLVLSLNIVLASIDRFPVAWSYISSPKLTATRGWLLRQPKNAAITFEEIDESAAVEKLQSAFGEIGLKTKVTENVDTNYATDEMGLKIFDRTENRRSLVVFGESGRINRLGAYMVHVCLLTLFLGHFVALQTGFDADVRMIPGSQTDQIQLIQFELDKKEKFNVQLPFAMECTDIQQKLIDPRGSIDVTNTLDWRTQMKVTDPQYGEMIADISMNQPFTYRGYRFFQAQTIPVGNARVITIDMTPEKGGETRRVEIPRNGSVTAPDGTTIQYDQFLPDFTFNSQGDPDTRTGEYNNPAAVLNVTPPNGERQRVFAFASKVAENIPVGAPKAGYKWRLSSFEKSPFAHILSIKYDPFNAAFVAWYFGGFGLIGALCFVFLFSHKRMWALIEERPAGGVEVTLGGDSNRNHLAFGDKFDNVASKLKE